MHIYIKAVVTDLRIYGFNPLPPPLPGRAVDADLLIKLPPVDLLSHFFVQSMADSVVLSLQPTSFTLAPVAG